MYTITHEVTLVVEECCACGTTFGMTADLQRNLRKTGREFFCPNGHPQVYTNTDAKKIEGLERQLKSAREDTAWWKREAEEKARSLSATKGALTKTKKRLAGGACPCCNRQFTNLARHMKTKHPDYAQEVTFVS